jgi:anti-sigma factor RsiW
MSEQATAKTIRLLLDGELPDAEAREAEQKVQADPRLARGVEFERNLRRRVRAVLQGEPVPPELADRVRKAMAGDAEPMPATARRSWWRSPNRANVFAVAASLGLVLGAVLFGILGPQIDTLRAPVAPGVVVEAARAAAGEHVMVATGGGTGPALPIHAPDEIERALAPYLDPASRIIDLSDLGYEIMAGTPCALPNCEQGCHLFYRKTGGQPGLVSLHVVPDRGQCDSLRDAFGGELPLHTGVVPQGRGCQKDVLVWSYRGRTYMLVVCIPRDVEVVVQRMQERLVGAGGPARPARP